MAVTFGGTTIVSDSAGAYRGICKLERGSKQLEISRRTFPRGSGVYETYIGKRDRELVLHVQYVSTAEATLVAAVEALKDNYYRTLVTPNGTFAYCRLDGVTWGMPYYGTRPDGTAVTVFPDAILRFVQVVT